jgi:hypothetical protein
MACVIFNVVNNELETMWKEAVVDKFKVLTRQFFGLTEVNHENLSRGIFFPSRHLNQGPLDHEGGIASIAGVQCEN